MEHWLDKLVYSTRSATGAETLRDTQSIIGIALIVLAVFTLTKNDPYPGWRALLPVVGAALIIGAGAGGWINRKLLSNRVLVWIGLISYPLYLWHWPLLAFARIAESQTPSREIRVAAVGLSLLLAWLTYRFVEKPMRGEGRRVTTTIVLSLVLLIVGYVGLNAYHRNGLPFRFPKVVQDLTQFKYDHSTEYRTGTCFLGAGQDYSAFDNCTAPFPEKKEKTLLLWGDPHAAHLYPGFREAFAKKYNIVQRTTAGCPLWSVSASSEGKTAGGLILPSTMP